MLIQDNVILFRDTQRIVKFVFTPVWIEWDKDSKGKLLQKQCCVISLKDVNGFEVIHPISDFIMSNWRNRKYNTQKKHASNLVLFLNHLLQNRRNLKINSLNELVISHGEEFLNSLSGLGYKRDSIMSVDRTLTKFYVYLKDNGLLHHINSSAFKKVKNIYKVHSNEFYYESPFQVNLPRRVSPNVEHSFPETYLPLLFEMAILFARPIALGLYFQIFGGLRVSEVVNVKRTQIKRRIKDGDVLLKLKDQNFRTDLKNTSGSNYVKRERHQTVFRFNDWLDILYNDHVNLYNDKNGSGALFINRDGKAMTERSYRQYFQKLKNKFIELLIEHGNSQDKLIANHLSIIKWSTHIGRGTFTNFIASEAENPFHIAFLRGDKDITSSLTYLAKTERLREKLAQKFQRLHSSYINELVQRRKADKG